MGKGSGKGSKQVTPYNSSAKAMTIPVSKSSYKTGTLATRPVDQSQAYGKTTMVLGSAFLMGKGSGKGSKQVTPYNSSAKAMTIPVSKSSYKTGTLAKRPVDQSQAYGKTTRVKYEDKQSGSYGRYARKEKLSSGEVHVEKGTGQVGVKDEFTKSSTIRIGNKSGYTEYHTEERFRDVKYGKTSNSNNGLIKNETHYEGSHDYGNDGSYECVSGYAYFDHQEYY